MTPFEILDEVRQRTAEAVIAQSGLSHDGLRRHLRELFAERSRAGALLKEPVLEGAHPFITAWTLDGKPIAGAASGRTSLRPPPKTDQPIVLEAKVTAAENVSTQLLVGCANPYEVKLDGKPVGTGKGVKGGPDRESFDVKLSKGEHTLTLVVRHTGVTQALYARFRDPERKLSYPEAEAKK